MERNTERLANADVLGFKIAAGQKLYLGKLVGLNDDGYAVDGDDTDLAKVLGRAEQTVDNTDGADGDQMIAVRRGIFKWNNDATDPVVQADVGQTVYLKDGVTVCADDSGVEAGVCTAVESDGVWVETR
ncbi:MAG: hypothetical protein WC959_05510 [Kiritimatiellales bacterium]